MLHVQEVSESSSVGEHDLSDLVPSTRHSQPFAPALQPGRVYSASHALDYQRQHIPAAHRLSLPSSPAPTHLSTPTLLQSFPSWDPTWRSGGVSADGRAYTTHVPEDYSRERHRLDDERDEDRASGYLGGWVSESDHDALSVGEHTAALQGHYQYGVGYDTDQDLAKQKGTISEERKAQRLKLLEREFGPSRPKQEQAVGGRKSKDASRPSAYVEEADSSQLSFKEMRMLEKEQKKQLEQEIGVGKDGRLITLGRRKRSFLRWMQGLLALIAALAGIGGAFATHPIEDPGPSGKLSTWALYIISVLSFLITFWTFAIRRCVKRDSVSKTISHSAFNNGLVLPMFSNGGYGQIGGSSKQKVGFFTGKSKKSKNMPMMHQQQPMTVNLVLDPATLASLTGVKPRESKPPSRYDDSGHTEDAKSDDGHEGDGNDIHDDGDFHIPSSSRSGGNRGPLSVIDTMSSMALQDRWKAARRQMKRQLVWDTLLALLWSSESVWAIGFTGSCKPGTAEGWCDTYNTALACTVLLAISFWASVTFDSLDLRRSRTPPRIPRR